MGIEPIQQSKGVSRATAVCDDCGAEEVVACTYVRDHHSKKTHPNEAQARGKMIGVGWSFVKGKLRCPTCEAKRKVVNMADAKNKRAAKVEPDREPTRAEKRKIMDMLEDVYDVDRERYMQGDTDDTVAEVLEVMPGWVAKLREEFFGPDGGNESIEALHAELEKAKSDFETIINSGTEMVSLAKKKLAQVSVMAADLEKIRRAVGPRNLKAAGLK